MRKLLILVGILMGIQLTHAQEPFPAQIEVVYENLNPEGIEYLPGSDRFLLSSLSEGTVFSVDADGNMLPYVEDEDLISSVGLQIDYERNRLIVVNADMTAAMDDSSTGLAQIMIYDLLTPERPHFVDLGSLAPQHRHFANDAAVDEDGNVYITDSLAPVLYKFDQMEGVASILLEDEALLIDGLGGNGIVYHPDGYLIVGISGVELYKIPLENPEAWSVVETGQVIGADGMIWHPDGSLVVVSNGSILKLLSDDDWASAEVVETARRYPATTAAIRDGEVYLINPVTQDGETYQIMRVDFPE